MDAKQQIEAVIAGESEGCIVCGGCLGVMKDMPDGCVDIVTDPPYGIRADESAAKAQGTHGWRYYGNSTWDRDRPGPQVFAEVLRVAQDAVIWGGNYFADMLPPSMGWLAWDKGQRAFSLADFEMAWTSVWAAARCFDYPRSRALGDGKVHPTQKPVALIKWSIEWLVDRTGRDCTVLCDPFCGSGTTCMAAKKLGRRWIGIDISEKYCRIAENRIRNTERPLFTE